MNTAGIRRATDQILSPPGTLILGPGVFNEAVVSEAIGFDTPRSGDPYKGQMELYLRSLERLCA